MILSVAVVLLCGLIIGLVVAGVEVSKESHVKKGVITDLDGEPTQTGSLESYIAIPSLLKLEQDDLAKVKQLSFGAWLHESQNGVALTEEQSIATNGEFTIDVTINGDIRSIKGIKFQLHKGMLASLKMAHTLLITMEICTPSFCPHGAAAFLNLLLKMKRSTRLVPPKNLTSCSKNLSGRSTMAANWIRAVNGESWLVQAEGGLQPVCAGQRHKSLAGGGPPHPLGRTPVRPFCHFQQEGEGRITDRTRTQAHLTVRVTEERLLRLI